MPDKPNPELEWIADLVEGKSDDFLRKIIYVMTQLIADGQIVTLKDLEEIVRGLEEGETEGRP